MRIILRRSVIALAIVAVLLAGWHRMAGHSLRDGLDATCSDIRRGDSLNAVLQQVANRGFEVRKSHAADGGDWFDRAYDRIVRDHRRQLSNGIEIALAFAGTEADFFVCVVVHEDDRVVTAWFETH